jgi:Tfp pilus assembly protein PilO
MLIGKLSWRIKAGMIVILSLFLMRFGLVPLYEWQGEIKQRIMVFKRAVAQKKAMIGSERRMDSLLQRAESRQKAVAQFFYQGYAESQTIQLAMQKEIERSAASIGVKINSTDWLPISEGDIVQVPIKIKCVATPDQILKFLQNMESGKRFFSVDRLSLSRRRRSAVLSAELDVSAYGVKEQR